MTDKLNYYLQLFNHKIIFKNFNSDLFSNYFTGLKKTDKNKLKNSIYFNCPDKIDSYNNSNKFKRFKHDIIIKKNNNKNTEYLFSNSNGNIAKINNYNLMFLNSNIPFIYIKFLCGELLQLFLETKLCGFSLHCSGLETKNGLLLFTGENGSGKSTIADYLSNQYPEKYNKICDDMILFNINKINYNLTQNPLYQKNKIYKNILKIIFLNPIKKSKNINYLKKLNMPAEAGYIVEQILNNIHKHYTFNYTAENIIDSVKKLTENFNNFYEYSYSKNNDLSILSDF